jgi:tRNA(Ile)-lysidine synthetase-like protein
VRKIPVPGVLRDTGAGWEFTAEVGQPMDAEEARRYCAPGGRAVVDFAAVGSKVYTRYRRPGDRFRPLGMRGHRKLQDVFVDAKVSRELRDRVPLVVDATDRIVWVVGHGIAADACAAGRATGVLLLGFRRLGGLG